MAERTARETAEAVAGEVVAGDPEARWHGAEIDSRRVRPGMLFFALEGETNDGHEYVPQAREKGATVFLTHRDVPETASAGATVVRVDDTYRALHELTRAVRRDVPERLVGITGSAGKTTTKEILAAMLARRFTVARSEGNFNNLYGFPLSLLNVAEGTEWMVAEMGMSTPGELGEISLLGRPDVAVYTCVRPVHLMNFDDLAGIAEAKSELMRGLPEDGLVVANADDAQVMRIVRRQEAQHPRIRVVTFGLGDDAAADVRASPPAPLDDRLGSRFRVTAGDDVADFELPLHGVFNVQNCLAAVACAHTLGVPLGDLAAAAAALRPAKMRGEVHRLAGRVVLVDDSYNSNPDAARMALEGVRSVTADRRVAILGDMLELGPREGEFHREVGAAAAELGFHVVAGVGELSAELVAAARAGGAEAVHLADAEAAAEWATETVRDGDLVVVKGSRGVGLDRVVTALVAARAAEDAD